MKEIPKATLPELSHHKLPDTIYLVLDTRDPIRIRYVDLVCQIPFGTGFVLCPWVRKELDFDTKWRTPKSFRTAERAITVPSPESDKQTEGIPF